MWIGALSPKKFSLGDDDILSTCLMKGEFLISCNNNHNYHSSGNFRRQKFSYVQLCTKIKCTKYISSQYIKYACYYGKGSPVRKLFSTKI